MLGDYAAMCANVRRDCSPVKNAVKTDHRRAPLLGRVTCLHNCSRNTTGRKLVCEFEKCVHCYKRETQVLFLKKRWFPPSYDILYYTLYRFYSRDVKLVRMAVKSAPPVLATMWPPFWKQSYRRPASYWRYSPVVPTHAHKLLYLTLAGTKFAISESAASTGDACSTCLSAEKFHADDKQRYTNKVATCSVHQN